MYLCLDFAPIILYQTLTSLWCRLTVVGSLTLTFFTTFSTFVLIFKAKRVSKNSALIFEGNEFLSIYLNTVLDCALKEMTKRSLGL